MVVQWILFICIEFDPIILKHMIMWLSSKFEPAWCKWMSKGVKGQLSCHQQLSLTPPYQGRKRVLLLILIVR